MIFNATIQAAPEETVECRVFDAAQGAWWDGVGWGDEASAERTVIPPVGSARHAGPVTYPQSGVVIEYLIDGELSGEDVIPVPAEISLSGDDATALAAAVAAGVGENLPSPVVIPLVSGTPATVVLTRDRRVLLKRGDSCRLVFSLGRDCTGWAPWFGGKRDPKQTVYDMPLRQPVYTDEAAGTGYIDLSSADTATPGTVFGELELRRGVEVNTPESYTFRIVDDIVK